MKYKYLTAGIVSTLLCVTVYNIQLPQEPLALRPDEEEVTAQKPSELFAEIYEQERRRVKNGENFSTDILAQAESMDEIEAANDAINDELPDLQAKPDKRSYEEIANLLATFDSSMGNNEGANSLRTLVQELYYNYDRDTAFSTLDGIRNKKTKSDALQDLVELMAIDDPDGTANWILSLSNEFQSAAIEKLLPIWTKSEPEHAANWAHRLEDKILRNQVAANTIKIWNDFDENSLTKWLIGTGLYYPEDVSEYMQLAELHIEQRKHIIDSILQVEANVAKAHSEKQTK